MRQIAEQQLPLPIVTEDDLSDEETALYFGTEYMKLLRGGLAVEVD